jgi:hypothetical protein
MSDERPTIPLASSGITSSTRAMIQASSPSASDFFNSLLVPQLVNHTSIGELGLSQWRLPQRPLAFRP